MGSQGMPRRYYDYVEEFAVYHQISTIGSYVMAIGFFVMAAYLLQSLVSGKKAAENPWGGATLEWRTASPPITENFEETPVPNDPYDYTVNRWDPKTGNFVYVGPSKPPAEAAGGH